jgi:hypothetical protein
MLDLLLKKKGVVIRFTYSRKLLPFSSMKLIELARNIDEVSAK